MENRGLAELMISHSLNRLYEINLFGSGYPMSPPRDYPHMIAEGNATLIYDSSHFNEVEKGEMDLDYLEYQELTQQQ